MQMLVGRVVVNQELTGELSDSGGPASGGAAPATVSEADTSAAATSATPASNEDVDSTGGNDDWGNDLLKEEDIGDTPDQVTEPAKAAEPVTSPAAQPAAQPAAPAVPVAQTPATSVPAQPVVPAIPAAAAPAPAETEEQKTARVAAATAASEKVQADLEKYYTLPEEDATRLVTEPELILPKLAAKMHQAMLGSVQQMLALQLPQYIQMVNNTTTAEAKSKDAFFSKWPGLKDHEAQVLQVGRMFRQANPSAAPDVAIAAIGKIVSEALGLTVVAGQPVAQAAVAPAALMYSPGGGGGGGRPAPVNADSNEFSRMAEEFAHDGD